MKTKVISKAILLQRYESVLKQSFRARYFGRGAMLLLICVTAFVNQDEWRIQSIFIIASILIALGWFIENWSADKGRRILDLEIESAERSDFDEDSSEMHKEWEDANIRADYYMRSRMLLTPKRLFETIEPILWVFLVSLKSFNWLIL